MKEILENLETSSIGYRALVDRYTLKVNPHFRWSFIIKRGARRVLQDRFPLIYLYDQAYALDNPADPFQHLTFALKHEGLNLEIIAAFFTYMTPREVQEHIAKNAAGKYERILWFLYETLTKQLLDIQDLTQGSYIDLLDDDLYYTGKPITHRRYRVNDNLLGNSNFCPFVRRTDFLKNIEEKKLDQLVRSIIKEYEQNVLDRASVYLYAQETMSSYQIEREQPSKQRIARFIQLIKKAEYAVPLTKEMLIELQNSVVDARFINKTYRSTQNYVGQTRDWHQQIVHYISPKPEDVDDLMQGLFDSLARMFESDIHPVVTAAAISFGFVFIHPFDDGNGRLHRFLIHYVLHQTGFTPQGMIFPVSAVILLDMLQYTQALERFSKPLMTLITNYNLDEQGKLVVHQKTNSLYRYLDYTAQAEYLATCIEKTIQTDFKKELRYLVNYDKAKKELQKIVDMPDRLIDLFINLVMQNKGILSEPRKQKHFSMLTDSEVKKMESVINQLLSDVSRPWSPDNFFVSISYKPSILFFLYQKSLLLKK